MTIQSISEAIESLPFDNQGGSLAFFGAWLGTIPDGIHQMTSIDIDNNTLILNFGSNIRLEICDPSHIEIMDDALIIWVASAVDFSWSTYDENTSAKNRYHYKFKLLGDEVFTNTNYEYPMIPKKDEPAFEMAWYMRGDMSHQPYHRQLGKVRKP